MSLYLAEYIAPLSVPSARIWVVAPDATYLPPPMAEEASIRVVAPDIFMLLVVLTETPHIRVRAGTAFVQGIETIMSLATVNDTPSYERPMVRVGETIGEQVVVDVVNPDHDDSIFDRASFVQGDALRLRVLQAGGGANTDTDLVLAVKFYVRHGSAIETYDWETP